MFGTLDFFLLLLLVLISIFFSVAKFIFYSPRFFASMDGTDEHKIRIESILEKIILDKIYWKISVLFSSFINAITLISFCVLVLYIEQGMDFSMPLWMELIFIGFLFLIFGEIFPRKLSLNFYAFFLEACFLIVDSIKAPFYTFFYTIDVLEKKLKSTMQKSFSIKEKGFEVMNVEFEKIALQNEEQQLMKNVLDIRSKPVRKVMTPRIDIIGVSLDETLEDILKKLSATGYSRLPLYENTIDDTIGIIYAKNLVQYLSSRSKKIDWKSVARSPIFVPETQYLDDVLKLFQENHIHIALVVDEYGTIAGLVTLDDIIEELLNNLTKEEHSQLYQEISKDVYRFDASISIEEFFEILNIPLQKDLGVDTLAGLILSISEDIPMKNETVSFQEFYLIIEKITNNRIESVIVSKNLHASKTNVIDENKK